MDTNILYFPLARKRNQENLWNLVSRAFESFQLDPSPANREHYQAAVAQWRAVFLETGGARAG